MILKVLLLVSKSSPPTNLMDSANVKLIVSQGTYKELCKLYNFPLYFHKQLGSLIFKVEFLGCGFILYLFQISTFPILKEVHSDKFLSNAENNSIR